jgi:hypothetical protein
LFGESLQGLLHLAFPTAEVLLLEADLLLSGGHIGLPRTDRLLQLAELVGAMVDLRLEGFQFLARVVDRAETLLDGLLVDFQIRLLRPQGLFLVVHCVSLGL